ncbi:MAG: hypothetical protein HQL63_05245 [Magnetococcales bacterium]|nr:hypothetical protein [Magnetococcales bacterium]MBF0322494.1 hypothetical protein [Magnetococcales bacterium]
MKKMFNLPIGLGTALLALPLSATAAGEPGKIIDPVVEWDNLWHELLIDIGIMGMVFAILGAYWVYKYRAKSPDDVGSGPTLSRAQMWAWAMVPAFIFMADDFFLAAKGWTVWNIYRKVPANALEVKVTASMWNWEFEYADGTKSTYYVDAKEGDGLVVPVGQPVVLRMTSRDVLHSFGLVKYRVKEDVMPGRITYIWFYPKEEDRTGFVTCVEYCGTNHANMYAPVRAVPPAEFEQWLKKKGNKV